MQEIGGVASQGVPSLRCFAPSLLLIRVPPLLLLHRGHLELLGGRGGDGRHSRRLLVRLFLLLLIESGDVVVHEEGVGLHSFWGRVNHLHNTKRQETRLGQTRQC